MYQKFLLEVFYPSHLLEILLGCISSWLLFERELCARMIYLPLIKNLHVGTVALDNWHHSQFGGLSPRYGSRGV